MNHNLLHKRLKTDAKYKLTTPVESQINWNVNGFS